MVSMHACRPSPLRPVMMRTHQQHHLLCSIVASISACHAEDPGSIPGGGTCAPMAGLISHGMTSKGSHLRGLAFVRARMRSSHMLHIDFTCARHHLCASAWACLHAKVLPYISLYVYIYISCIYIYKYIFSYLFI